MSTSHQSPQDAFDTIDDLDSIAQTVLTEHQRTAWNLMRDNQGANQIAEAMGITPKCARELRARVQIRVREAAAEKHLGQFRCAITVQRGTEAKFVEDNTARRAIENAERGLRRAA